MPNAPPLSPDDISRLVPVDPDDIRQSTAHGLRYDGRKRMRHADDSLAAIAADHLVRFLEARGYVVLKRPPSPTDTATECVFAPGPGASTQRRAPFPLTYTCGAVTEPTSLTGGLVALVKKKPRFCNMS
jgi:hypothetical protein